MRSVESCWYVILSHLKIAQFLILHLHSNWHRLNCYYCSTHMIFMILVDSRKKFSERLLFTTQVLDCHSSACFACFILPVVLLFVPCSFLSGFLCVANIVIVGIYLMTLEIWWLVEVLEDPVFINIWYSIIQLYPIILHSILSLPI